MDSLNFDILSKSSTFIDAKGADFPAPVQRLKLALNRAKDDSLFAVATTARNAEPNIRDFCKGTGNVFMGVDTFDDHDVYYVKKRTVKCQRCSNMRAVTLGLVAAGVLAYTAPQVFTTHPTGLVTVLFVASVAALPPVLINVFRVFKDMTKKINAPSSMKEAD